MTTRQHRIIGEPARRRGRPDGLELCAPALIAAALERGPLDRLRVQDGGRAIVIVNRAELAIPAPPVRRRRRPAGSGETGQ